MRRSTLLALLVTTVASTTAFAGDGDTVLSFVPPDTRMLIGVDVSGLASTDAFERLYPLAEQAEAFADQDLATLLGIAPDEALSSIVIAIDSLESDGGPPLIILEHAADPSALDQRLSDLATREANRFGAPCWSAAPLWLCRPSETTIVVGTPAAVTRATALAWDAAERPDLEAALWPDSVHAAAVADAEAAAAEAAADADEAAADSEDDNDDAADDAPTEASDPPAAPPVVDLAPVEPGEAAVEDDDAIDQLEAWLEEPMPETLATTIAGLERGSGVWMVVVPGEDAPEPWIASIDSITSTVRLSDALRIRLRITYTDAALAATQRDVIDAGLTGLAGRPELRAVGLADAVAGFTATVEGTVLAVRLDVPGEDVDALVEQGAAILTSELE